MKDDHTMKKNHNTQKERKKRKKRMNAGEEREEKLSMLQQTRE
jgi:hypothetical protein